MASTWSITLWTRHTPSRWSLTAEFLPGTMAAKTPVFQALLTYPKGFLVSYTTSFWK